MSPINAARTQTARSAAAAEWQSLCARHDLVANSGVVAWIDGQQVALFHLPDSGAGEQVFAIANKDPKSGANVIGRGILGQIKGELVIASPLYKQHFRLVDGRCLEYPEQQLKVWPARIAGDAVEIAVD